MENEEENLQEAFHHFMENLANNIKRGHVIIDATVVTKSVNLTNYTCSVQISRGTDYTIPPQSDSAGSPAAPSGNVAASPSSGKQNPPKIFANIPLKVLISSANSPSTVSFIEIPDDTEGNESAVLMTFRDGNVQRPQLLFVDKCKEILMTVTNGDVTSTIDIIAGLITINGGNNDGLVKISDLISKINRLENAFNHHTHLTAGTGSPVPPTVLAPHTDIIPINPLTVKSDMEDTSITH
jgi:hypothetical protein